VICWHVEPYTRPACCTAAAAPTSAVLCPAAASSWLSSPARFPVRSILRLPPSAKATASPCMDLRQRQRLGCGWRSACVHWLLLVGMCCMRAAQLTTTLLPHPFGPTTQVKSDRGPITALSLKLLKPVLGSMECCEVLELLCAGLWRYPRPGWTYPRPPGVSGAAACCRCCLPAWLQVHMSQA
jgi:hypothetical protein